MCLSGLREEYEFVQEKIGLTDKHLAHAVCTSQLPQAYVYYLFQGGYVLTGICLSVCLCSTNNIQKVINRF